jgi:clan AA aspartic protease (TIGR02281 family)
MIGKITAAFSVLLMLTACHGSPEPAPLWEVCGEGLPASDAVANARSRCVNGRAALLLELFGSTEPRGQKQPGSATTVSLEQHSGGSFLVPVTINGWLTLMFVVDSGASDVSIPADIALALLRTGTLSGEDFLENTTYMLADGSTVPSQTFRIRSLKIGDRVLENVVGGVTPAAAYPLLGQSFLGRFKSWSIHNSERVLVLEE